jgi:hypothetical protein
LKQYTKAKKNNFIEMKTFKNKNITKLFCKKIIINRNMASNKEGGGGGGHNDLCNPMELFSTSTICKDLKTKVLTL